MSLRSFLKAGVKRGITLPGIRVPFQAMMRDNAIIFMLHSAQDAQGRPEYGFDPAILRHTLQRLRRDKARILSLMELVEAIESGSPLNGAVVFTMDDGYREQGTIAGQVFTEFDCPSTLFLTTGFIDGDLWPWWDKIEYIFDNARQKDMPDKREFVLRCKDLSEEKLQSMVTDLAACAEVEIPAKPPARYTPLTWQEIRGLERKGMTFAPHSVTHPILSRDSAERSAAEIRDSWQRVKENVALPIPVFAYPVGRAQDFGDREIAVIKDSGLRAAVSAEHAYVTSSRDSLFRLPRLVLPEDEESLAALLGGIEHLRASAR
jgi:peptidoglycan/xylan/chitin deacetylase (PgdA/CDA1 family)